MTASHAEPLIRLVRADERDQLIDLYRHLKPEDPQPQPGPSLAATWNALIEDPRIHVLVAELDARLVASVTLYICLNLTRGATPFALIENVVTHNDYRRRGLATGLLRRAQRIAFDEGCYKVMLQTGSKDPATLRFYAAAGFQANLKTAYVALPDQSTA